MRLGFPQPCFWISTNPAYCSSRRVLTAFCRPQWSRATTSQIGIVQVNAPIFVRPAVFPGQVCPAQDKGIQYLCFVGQGCECGGFKKEIGKPGKADRLFRLMDINGVCHIVFCGRLEACFRGQTVVSIACPCSVLAKPCKSRTFQPLTVHTRPPFPFTFCFLPPVNSGGTAGAVFCPVGFRDEHTAADRTAFQVLIPENLRFQRPDPAARPPSGTTYSRPRKKPSAGRCRCPHRQGAYSSRPHNSSTPGGSGRLPVSSVPVSCGKGNRPACALWAAVVYMGSLSCVPSILLSVAVLPEKASCPIPAACSGVGTLPTASGQVVPK